MNSSCKNNKIIKHFFKATGFSVLIVLALCLIILISSAAYAFINETTVTLPFNCISINYGKIGTDVEGIEFNYKNNIFYMIAILTLVVSVIYTLISSFLGRARVSK